MSLSGDIGRAAFAAERLKWLRDNAVAFCLLAARRPRSAVRPVLRLRFATAVAAMIILIVVTMIVIDTPSMGIVKGLPEWVIAFFDRITHFGNAHWLLVPVACALAALAALASPVLPDISRRVLATIAVRLAFLFWAIALPGIFFTIAKRLIGRARPLVNGSVDPFLYLPLGWSVEYASFPSGHATDAFAAATAIGALWPQARALMWTYALMIAVSRVVLTAHFPSDVIAGATAGVIGALLVRAWCGSRRLVFARDGDGHWRPMPGPSLVRIKRVARQLFAA
jgi:undecaprenyl-diphosphatase